ncbi:DUF3306 domain-containing protein [Parasalinivibrio latis]|uniref:DUF3306 domain-containing protein n=1 Tax=Parasalinivibrio latis TaxID=2952610 RepID=UPI0030E36A45
MATDSFLRRWSDRKLANEELEIEDALEQPKDNESTEEATVASETQNTSIEESEVREAGVGTGTAEEGSGDVEVAELSLDDVENLKSDESVSAFLAAGVSSQVKKAALRKIFFSDAYNEVDGLLDYDQDFSSTPDLAADAANGLRKWVKEQFEEDDKDVPAATEAESARKSTPDPEEEIDAEQENTVSELDQEDNSEYTEIETKSTHGQDKDNLSYSEGQNVPIQEETKNSDGF